MGGYIGTTKRDIRFLIDSVMEPGVSVKREIRVKPFRIAMGGVGILYHFCKNGNRLFSICILPKGDTLSSDFYQWSNLEASILRDSASSDVIRKDDDAFREMRVLCQLAEKMYEEQNALNQINKQQENLKAVIGSEIGSHKK